MNEVFEKIIEKLEADAEVCDRYHSFDYAKGCRNAILIVRKVAEKYNGGWIPCDVKMPEERDSMFAKLKGTNKWSNAMFEKASDVVNVTVVDDKGKRVTTHAYTIDGKWCCGLLKMNKTYRIVAWRPFPEPYKEIEVNNHDD